jgi:hypothetical protein
MTTMTVAPPELARPLWRRVRFWLALGVALLVGALAVAALAPSPGRALDPRSPAKGGSKALARLLHGYGVPVRRTTDLGDATAAGPGTSVLVVAADAYSRRQLGGLRGAGRVVLLEPDAAALAALAPAVSANDSVDGVVGPGCSEPGARAAGAVDLGAGATTYTGADGCYDGAFVRAGRVAVLGSDALLRNDALADRGVAALDVNVLTADRTLDRVVWLLPGADAAGSGAPTVWALFPAGVHRALLWLLLTGVVVVLWRARRLGPPVSEPLPVVVRAAEVVEGHGRLYRRAGARDRAAAALRAGTVRRLAHRLGLPRGAGAHDVVAVRPDADPAGVLDLLAGPAPADDAQLLALAARLADLEAAAGVPPEEKGEG